MLFHTNSHIRLYNQVWEIFAADLYTWSRSNRYIFESILGFGFFYYGDWGIIANNVQGLAIFIFHYQTFTVSYENYNFSHNYWSSIWQHHFSYGLPNSLVGSGVGQYHRNLGLGLVALYLLVSHALWLSWSFEYNSFHK